MSEGQNCCENCLHWDRDPYSKTDFDFCKLQKKETHREDVCEKYRPGPEKMPCDYEEPSANCGKCKYAEYTEQPDGRTAIECGRER